MKRNGIRFGFIAILLLMACALSCVCHSDTPAPDASQPSIDAAAALIAKGEYAAAATMLESIVANVPEQRSAAYIQLANCMCAQGRYAEALDFAQKAVDTASGSKVDAMLRKAACLDALSRFADELSCLQEVIDLYPDLKPDMMLRSSSVLEKMRRYNDAYAELERFTMDYPSSAHVPAAKGEMGWISLYGLKDYVKASSIYESIIEQYPDDPVIRGVRWELPTAYTNQKRHIEAAKTLELALALYGAEDPDHVLLDIADCYRRMGRSTGAIQIND